ncbi:hypothetical protein GO755_31340 [Spirosoma sp. HMF4905]|uniref:Uncharacterized protein n=1 Tax=Spirosoma arboris TaxID=2682092 RepID=A0A7K1SLA6_9BACT|nr:hypothetical protein [Spirosoma arboris]MVM34565.1 hypothetical protein [Spirosoma arboris]
MYIDQTVYLFVLLVFTPFLTLGQKVTNSGLMSRAISLSDKTFIIGEEGEASKTGNDLNLYLIFHKDGSATFRAKRGNTITKENPLSWQFVGDSLYIQNSPITIQAEGKMQTIDREPMKYFTVKAPGGYVLKGKGDQMLLIELK